MTKRTILISIVAIIIVIGCVGLVVYLQLIDITLKVTHVRSVSVSYNGISLASVNQPGTLTFKAPRNATISVRIVGDDTHESSTRTIKTSDKPLVTSIVPYYSKHELNRRASQESPAITSAIVSYNSTIPVSYTVKNVELYHYADWASAKLVWNGDETENSDTLRVILKRSGSDWIVVNKPDILLYKGYFNSVPIDVLRTVNTN